MSRIQIKDIQKTVTLNQQSQKEVMGGGGPSLPIPESVYTLRSVLPESDPDSRFPRLNRLNDPTTPNRIRTYPTDNTSLDT